MYKVLFFVWWISIWNLVYSHDLIKDLRLHGLNMPRFNIGEYRRKRKQMEEKKLEQKVQSSSQIIQIETEIVEREIVLAKKRKQSHAMDEKLRNLDAKV